MSVIKTGMVYQRTVKGPNYICLGRATVEGKTMIVSVKNGNINYSGDCKKLKASKEVRLEMHHPENIARIHDVRKINVKSVFSNGNHTKKVENTVSRLVSKGVRTEAELPNVRKLK